MEENTETDEPILPSNPIEEKDLKNTNIENDLEKAKISEHEIKKLKDELTTKNAELKSVKESFDLSQKKINFTRNATEDLLLESISRSDGYKGDPVLDGVYSATLNEEDFEIDDDSKEIRSRRDHFLKSIEDKIDSSSTDQKERFVEIKNKILEKVKFAKVSRIRSRSGSSLRKQSSTRKRSCSDDKVDDRPTSRPRTQLPVPAK